MTLAISEILKQVESLSSDEQQELRHALNEQMRRQPEAAHSNGVPKASSPAPVTSESSEAEEDGTIFDVHSLNRVPPQRTYTMKVRYKFIGRGKPMPYELDEELLEEEAATEVVSR